VTYWLSLLQLHRVIAVVRTTDADIARQMILAAAAGGIRLIEITWNSDRVETLIPQLQQELPQCWIGTGTILNPAMAKEAIACGAKFMFTPHVDRDLIAIGKAQNIPVIPGALTPTEILTAWQLGATVVKVFPIKTVGGVEYLNCLRPVLGEIPLLPTGGVTMANAIGFLQAGAIAVGISSDLFDKQAIATGNWAKITANAQFLVRQIEQL
jgi:2-dehydro-3-deoxyphosphogluconate aldolase / (4S)-4-hydroxy-2-oxoglutarate aldolase